MIRVCIEHVRWRYYTIDEAFNRTQNEKLRGLLPSVLLVCIERNRDVSFPVELSRLAESKKIRLHQPAINLSPVKFSYRRSSVAKCEILVNVRDTTRHARLRFPIYQDVSISYVSYFYDALYIFFDVRYRIIFCTLLYELCYQRELSTSL